MQDAVAALEHAARGCLFQKLVNENVVTINRTAADLRSMQQMAYFHAKSGSKPSRWTRKPVRSLPSLSLSYSGNDRDILTVMHLNASGPAPHLWKTVVDEALAVRLTGRKINCLCYPLTYIC